MKSIPLPVRVAAGLAATAVEQARTLPAKLAGLPVTVASQALQVSMRVQQQVTELAIRGDEVLSSLSPVEENPEWATFDEDFDDGPDEPGTRTRRSAFDRVADDTDYDSDDDDTDDAAGDAGRATGGGAGRGAFDGDDVAGRAAGRGAGGASVADVAGGAGGAGGADVAGGAGVADRDTVHGADRAGGDGSRRRGGAAGERDHVDRGGGGAAGSGEHVDKGGGVGAGRAGGDAGFGVGRGPVDAAVGGRANGFSADDPWVAEQRAMSARAEARELDFVAAENYDALSLPQLRARLRRYSADELAELLEYERAHGNRPSFVGMLTRRIATVRDTGD